MSVEIDISKVKWGSYYRDDRCKEIEAILHDDSNYRECIVERQHYHEDITNDPYVVKDENGKESVILETWQIDALSPSELLSFIKIQQRRDQCVDRTGSVAYFVLFASFLLGSTFSLITIVDIVLSYTTNLYNLVSFPVMIVSGIVYYLKYKNSYLMKRAVDLEAARSDSSFLEALRKLAAVSKSEYEFVYNNEHIMRLKHIETALAGVSS